MRNTFLIPLSILFNSIFLYGQTKQSDDSIERYNNYLNFYSFIKNTSTNPHWLADGNSFWYSETVDGKNKIYIFDPVKNSKKELFDNEKLIRSLTKYVDKSKLIDGVPFRDFEFINDEKDIKFSIEDKEYILNLLSYEITPSIYSNNLINHEIFFSPDKKEFVFIRENNIFLGNSISTESLTADGSQDNSWTINKNTWSHDGTRLLVRKSDTQKVHHLPVVDYNNAKEEVKWNVYAKTGDNIEKTDLYVINVVTKNQTLINIETEDYYIFPVGWRKDNSEILFMRLTRNGKKLELYGANPNTGKCRIILTETQKTFASGLDFIVEKWVRQCTLLNDGNAFIWMSERDGWRHLYLYNMDGKLIRRLTEGSFPVIEPIKVDEEAGWIYFRANAEANLYSTQLYRVNFEGKKFKRLTDADGSHYFRFSPSGKYFLDSHSGTDRPPVTEVRNTEGKLLQVIKTADVSELKKIGWNPPEKFIVKAADGITDLYGILYKPFDFNPNKKYPIVEFIYAGPFITIVPNGFLPTTDLSLQAQALAQLGYITFLVDGRGTTERSKAFQDTIYGNIGKYEISDHVAALKQLAEERDYMDLERVGILGHSWGGYFAIRAMLSAPNIYKVGIASAPGELTEGAEIMEPYMDLPINNKEGYDYGLNINNAQNLQGKLLFIHGTSDTNAPFSATVRMIDALIKAGKAYDLLLLPGETHFYEGIYLQYVNEAVKNYFEKYLK